MIKIPDYIAQQGLTPKNRALQTLLILNRMNPERIILIKDKKNYAIEWYGNQYDSEVGVKIIGYTFILDHTVLLPKRTNWRAIQLEQMERDKDDDFIVNMIYHAIITDMKALD